MNWVEAANDAAAAAYADHKATAHKRGRNQRWPYVPVYTTNHLGRVVQHQLTGKAFATRDEAVAHAQAFIATNQAGLARRILDKGARSLREFHGLPREIPDEAATVRVYR